MNMKKLLFVLASVLLLTSCGTVGPIVSYLDYSKYAQEDFFITPTPYYGDYTPCGEIFIVMPAHQVVEDTDMKIDSRGYNQYGNYVAGGAVRYQKYTKEELIEQAVKSAKEKGADALVNFKCMVVISEKYNTVIRYEISGFCIKRK